MATAEEFITVDTSTSAKKKRRDSSAMDPVFLGLEVTGAPATANDVVRKTELDTHVTQHNPGGSDAISTAAATTISTSTVNAEGVATSVARSDHTHAVDIPTTLASATGATTETSITDVLISGLTLTPAAGDYLVSFGTTLSHGTNDISSFYSVYVGNIQEAASEKEFDRGKENASRYPGTISSYPVTVNGSQAIEIRWRTDAGTVTSSVARYMSIFKVGN